MSVLYQGSHAFVFEQRRYDGTFSLETLKQHGDIGLGTFHAMDGELVVFNNACYQCTEGKYVKPAKPGVLLPWAAVTRFTSEVCTNELVALANLSALEAKLLELMHGDENPYVFHIQGEFNSLIFRDVLKQNQPYLSIEQVFETSPQQETGLITADLVGFYMPEFMYPMQPQGLHLHGLSTDKAFGGHVLEVNLKSAHLQFEKITQLHVDLVSCVLPRAG